jgi:beta-glucanase (GH16 family)
MRIVGPVFTAFLSAALAGCSLFGVGPSRFRDADAEVVFFDDFSGPALDRTKWNVEVTGRWVNDEQQAYIDSEEVIRTVDGALVIRARPRPGFVTPEGRRFEFVSGRINTMGKVEITSGTVSARIKLPEGSGLWPAFWLLGTGRWPETGEIDIMEYVGEPDWVSAALHGPGYSGETPLVNKLFLPAGDDATDWHVYSVDWRPDGFVFRVDDHVMYRATRTMVEHYGAWSYDTPKFLILNFALGGAYPVKINGERGTHRGLPAATAQIVRDGGARMLVDWVRVTR